MRMFSWYDPAAATTFGRILEDQLRYTNANGTYTAAFAEHNPATGKVEYTSKPISLSTLIVLIWARARHGLFSYKPFDTSLMVPIHIVPVQTVPEGKTANTFKEAIRVPCLVQGIDKPLMWTCAGNILLRELKALHGHFMMNPEAAEGQLQVYRIRPSRQFTVNVEMPDKTIGPRDCTAPVLEPTSWMAYDEALFGKREVPPPPLRVGVTPAAPMLSQDQPAAAETADDDQDVPFDVNPVETPTPTEVPVEPPKEDPFKNIPIAAKPPKPRF